jgi:AcrR family transcriptional regulator
MAAATRRSRPRPGLDRLLAPAAVGLFAEHGYEATTLRQLAARLDVTVAAVWHHYRTKDALLAAAIEPLLAAQEAEALRAERWAPTGPDGGELQPDLPAARALLGGLLDVWLSQRRAYAFVTRDLSVLHHRDHRERIAALHQRLRTLLARLAGIDDTDLGHVTAAAALGVLSRPVTNLDLDLEPHRHVLVNTAYSVLTAKGMPSGGSKQP